MKLKKYNFNQSTNVTLFCVLDLLENYEKKHFRSSQAASTNSGNSKASIMCNLSMSDFVLLVLFNAALLAASVALKKLVFHQQKRAEAVANQKFCCCCGTARAELRSKFKAILSTAF